MKYVIIGQDVPRSLDLRKQNRPAHLARLESLQNEGRLILAGPFPAVDNEDPADAGFTGSLIVAEFSDIEAAKTWANQDPYLLNGVYQTVTVTPFKQVF